MAQVRPSSERALREAFSAERGYIFRERMLNPPVSGLLFRSTKNVVFNDAIDALRTGTPFLCANVHRRGRRLGGLKLVMLPLPRPVPNMVLLNRRGGVLRNLGIALNETQQLNVEGNFSDSFTLYCPAGYETDALYVFTPDLLGRLMDAAQGCDLEVVDNRVLIYAPAKAFSKPEHLAALPDLVGFLLDKFDRQTQRYRDDRSSDEVRADPFRRAQVIAAADGSEQRHIVAEQGHRLRTRTTATQKVGIALVSVLAASAATYWVWMVATALFAQG